MLLLLNYFNKWLIQCQPKRRIFISCVVKSLAQHLNPAGPVGKHIARFGSLHTLSFGAGPHVAAPDVQQYIILNHIAHQSSNPSNLVAAWAAFTGFEVFKLANVAHLDVLHIQYDSEPLH